MYHAVITDIYDADTVTVDVDLGLHAKLMGEKMRLHGINAPEVRGPERPAGIIARNYLRDMLQDRAVTIETFKDTKGKYGRWLCRIWLGDVDVNAHLVGQGYAKWRDYG